MRSPVKIDLVADRGVAFSDTITRVGVNLTGATFRMQVRLYPDAPGTPIITMTTGAGVFLSYGGTATVSAHITAGRLTSEIYSYVNPATGVNYVAADSVALTVLLLGVSAATMAGVPTGLIPYPAERGDDWVGAWDLLVDTDGGGSATEDKWFYGEFRVRGSATQ